MGVVQVLPVAFPYLSTDLGLPDGNLEKGFGFITAGFAALGIGGKIEKTKRAIKNGTSDPGETKG
jgi:hypothetical protein